MKILKSALSSVGFVSAIGLLGGCGDNRAELPSAQSLPAAQSADRRGSWMADDAKNQDLLYVADLGTHRVNVYSYPAGRLKGVLKGFSSVHHECVDRAGNVFIANGGANDVLEYAHGGTAPIKTYHVPGFAHGCAIDPTNGNLAVLHDPASPGPGGISIYRHARGKRHEYTTPNVFQVYFIGYDGQGDLFVDGTDMQPAFEIAELPAGSQASEAATLDQSIILPGAIQWDGHHLAVGDQVSIYGPSKIYEFSMSGTAGTLVGTTPLSNSCDVPQFWIQGRRVIAGNDCAPHVLYFSYPSGGLSTKTIRRELKEPIGVVVSLK